MLPGETNSNLVDIDEVYGREIAHEVILQAKEDYRVNFG
jgi:inorganic pyrophosphatase